MLVVGVDVRMGWSWDGVVWGRARAHLVSGLQQHNVTNDDLLAAELVGLAISDDLDILGGHGHILELPELLLLLVVVTRGNEGHNHHGGDNGSALNPASLRVVVNPDGKRHQSRDDQDLNSSVLNHGVNQERQEGRGRSRRSKVRTEGAGALRNRSRRDPVVQRRLKEVQQAVRAAQLLERLLVRCKRLGRVHRQKTRQRRLVHCSTSTFYFSRGPRGVDRWRG